MPPDAQTTTVAATETDLSNDFDAVFDAIIDGSINDEESATTQAADGATNTANDDPQSGKPGDGTGDPAQPAQPGGHPAAADGEGQPAGTGDDAVGDDKGNAPPVDWEAKFAALEARINAQPPAPAAPAQADPPKDIPIYSDAEVAELTTLQKDWPEIKRLVELMTRQTEVNVVKYTFGEMGKILTPLQQSVSVITGNEHVDALYSAHADYDQAYNPCMEWIGKQPAFLKKTYENVVKNGTSEEVIDMMQKFKDETKWVAPTAAAPTAPAARTAAKPQSKAELSVAAKQAAQAIGAVGTKRGGAPAAQDPADFDGAWDEAIASK